MTIKVGTIQEVTGEGYEILVDSETRSYVLARFLDGNFVGSSDGSDAAVDASEKTLVM